MKTNVHGKVTIKTPTGQKQFWVFKEDNKVAGLKCSCTGTTQKTATQMKYNIHTDTVECPHCHKKPEIIETVKEFRAKQEAEIQALRNKTPLKLTKSVFDFSTGIQFYTLNKRITEEDWEKVAHLFTYIKAYQFEDAEDAHTGWYTTYPQEVEKILGITETQEKQEEKQEETMKQEKENKKHLQNINDAFHEATPIEKTKLTNLLRQGETYEHPKHTWTDHNIYGGGILYIVKKQEIIQIQNNGTDGADWSMNNIETGGAGAIGVTIPYSKELATEIREYCNKYPKT